MAGGCKKCADLRNSNIGDKLDKKSKEFLDKCKIIYKDRYKKHKYILEIKFGGYTECLIYSKDIYLDVTSELYDILNNPEILNKFKQ